MKKTLIATAVMAATFVSLNANAQSSVTVYGRLNVTLERIKTDTETSTSMVNNSSRWGVKGTEDLGGGMKAGFALESGFNPGDGKLRGEFFGRQSEVNLSGGFGMLRLGNFTSEAYFATADYVSNHNHDTGPSSDALYAYLGNDKYKIAYRLPEFAKNLSIEGSVALADNGITERTHDLAVNWSMGDLALGAGYQKYGDANQFAVRAFYNIGAFGFGGYVQRDKNAWGPNSGSRTNVRLSGMYSFDKSELHVNVGAAGDVGNTANSGAAQFTLGYNYKLSKRTKVYGYYTTIDGDISAPSYGSDRDSFALGIRHNF